MPPTQELVLLGTFVHCKTREELEFFHGAALGVDCSGKIAGFVTDKGDVSEARDELVRKLGWEGKDVCVKEAAAGQFFFPGFIDTHIHASQYPNSGLFGKSTLMDWLNTYTFPLEASLRDLGKARRVYTACIRRTLSHGTTTAAYFATVDAAATNLLADLCLGLGQRAFVGRVCMDERSMTPDFYRDESAEEGIKATWDVIEHVRGIDPGYEVVCPILTPRFGPSCTGESMRGLAEIHRQTGLPIQTHVSENLDEIAAVKTLFPASASYASVYDDHGLLTDRTILAHGVHLSRAEARLIALRGAKVSHCPCSNTSITSGLARVKWLWDQGVQVGLGTDVSGGYSPSVLEAARQAALVSRCVAMGVQDDPEGKERTKLTVEESLFLATRGGAQVVGLEDKVGGFEVGKDWDAQLIGLHDVETMDSLPEGHENEDSAKKTTNTSDEEGVDIFGWETWEERLAKWLFTGDDRNTKNVWVKGRLVHSRQ